MIPTVTPPVISAVYVGLCALIYLWLTWSVIARRRGDKISLGDGGDAKFSKVIRGQANAAEQMPLVLLMLVIADMMGAPGIALHCLGLMFVVGRLLHGLHFTGRGPFVFRPVGMLLTLLTSAVLALGLTGHAVLMAL